MEWTAGRIRTLRLALRLTQEEFADRLQAAPKTVRNWELGRHPPGLALQRSLDAVLGTASEQQRQRFAASLRPRGVELPGEEGHEKDRRQPLQTIGVMTSVARLPTRALRDGNNESAEQMTVDRPLATQHIEQSRDDWASVRRILNQQRAALTAAASRSYAPADRLGSTGILSRPDWRPQQPVDVGCVALDWVAEPEPPEVTGREPQTRAVRPLAAEERRYPRYSHALREVDPPALFENRVSFRLLDVAWTDEGGRLAFGPTTYFENVDVGEALAHELTLVQFAHGGAAQAEPVAWRRLPFRRLVGNPFNLSRRPLLPSIDTLTIRSAADSVSFILHQRDPRQVAVAGGMFHVMPAGVFQPGSILPSPQHNDFDLWRSMMREYSEEFLGNPDHDGTGPPIRYESEEPFRTLDQARREDRLRAWCFGIGLDALTLNGEILTAVVFDDDVFDQVFADLVSANSEGVVLSTIDPSGRTRGLPFTEAEVQRLLHSARLAPAAAACLRLAWDHRDILLDTAGQER